MLQLLKTSGASESACRTFDGSPGTANAPFRPGGRRVQDGIGNYWEPNVWMLHEL